MRRARGVCGREGKRRKRKSARSRKAPKDSEGLWGLSPLSPAFVGGGLACPRPKPALCEVSAFCSFETPGSRPLATCLGCSRCGYSVIRAAQSAHLSSCGKTLCSWSRGRTRLPAFPLASLSILEGRGTLRFESHRWRSASWGEWICPKAAQPLWKEHASSAPRCACPVMILLALVR